MKSKHEARISQESQLRTAAADVTSRRFHPVERIRDDLLSRLAASPHHHVSPKWRLGTGVSETGLLHKLRTRVWPRITAPFLVPWLQGSRIHVYPGDETSHSIFFTGTYEPNEFHLLDMLLTTGMTFLDVGANMGLYTLFAAKRVGDVGLVVAVEPSSRELERLRANVSANDLRNVCIVSSAVSNSSGSGQLLVAQADKSGHNTFGNFGYESVRSLGYESVAVTTIDEMVTDQDISTVHIVKIDIEGAELRALQGARQTLEAHHPLILLEVSDRTLNNQGTSSSEVGCFLQDLGYALYHFDAHSGLPTPAVPGSPFDSENLIALHALSRVEWCW